MISKSFEVLDFAGLCWPSLAFLAFLALHEFFKQRRAFGDKNLAKLSCSNNQMSKPISESKSTIYSTVCEVKPFFQQVLWCAVFFIQVLIQNAKHTVILPK